MMTHFNEASNLHEAMTAGVVVEYRNHQGHTVGQAVFCGWDGRPLPAVGDRMVCEIVRLDTGREAKVLGRVQSRQFDVQNDDGRPSVWAHLVVTEFARRVPSRRAVVGFSVN